MMPAGPSSLVVAAAEGLPGTMSPDDVIGVACAGSMMVAAKTRSRMSQDRTQDKEDSSQTGGAGML